VLEHARIATVTNAINVFIVILYCYCKSIFWTPQ
jgi:hypothetical protein